MSVTSMPAPTAAPDKDGKPAKRGGKLIKLAVIAVVVGALGFGGWHLTMGKPKPKQPQEGLVQALASTQLNLAAGHYLKVGIALQLTQGTKEIDGSKALDSAIALFSGKSLADLALPAQREDLKRQLTADLEKRYPHEVMGVYFTEFVTQ